MARGTQPLLSALAEEWLAETAIKGKSQTSHSDAARRTDLVRFVREMFPSDNKKFELSEIDALDIGSTQRADLVAAIASLSVTYAQASVYRTLSTWRNFTRWLTQQGYIDKDIFEGLTVAAPSNEADVATKHLRHDEIQGVLEAAENPKGNAWSAWPSRDVAILQVLAGCGVRANELCQLDVSSIARDLEVPMLLVRGGSKGNKARDVPIPRSTLAAVDRYLVERANRPGWELAANNALFVREQRSGSQTGVTRIDRTWLYRLVKRTCKDAGIVCPPDAAVHSFRHAYGVETSRRGVPLVAVQAAMGHSSPVQTGAYAKFSASHVAEALDDAGWL